MIELSLQQRSLLRAQAHALQPVVQIATNGLSATVLAEIERSLQAHELIKIKTRGAEREQRENWLRHICRQLNAQAVQHIGGTLIIWRKRRETTPPPATTPSPIRPSTTKKPARLGRTNAPKPLRHPAKKRLSPAASKNTRGQRANTSRYRSIR